MIDEVIHCHKEAPYLFILINVIYYILQMEHFKCLRRDALQLLLKSKTNISATNNLAHRTSLDYILLAPSRVRMR